MNTQSWDFSNLTTNEQIIFWLITGLSILIFVLSIGLFSMWIYYSWIRRQNSKNYTGEDITKYIFDKTGTDVEIKNSWFYIKYWNYNKRKGTHKLRPWTFNRKSIWTMMEASQQAYATTIRKEKAKQYWFLFRIPGVIRIASALAAVGLFYLGIKDAVDLDHLNFKNWLWIGLGISVLFIGYTIADVGKVYILWKNVVPLLKESGLVEEELKAINRIYFWRMIYSMVVVILEMIKLVMQIAEKTNNKK